MKSFKELAFPQKLQFIWDYYKLPILLAILLLVIGASCIHKQMTKKEILLSAAFVNVAPSDKLLDELTDQFLRNTDTDLSRNTFYTYSDLLLTEDTDASTQQYAYASKLKLMAAIDAANLDLVFMNQEAYDAFSQNGYLCDLRDFLSAEDSALASLLKNDIVENTVIWDDNSSDVALDSSIPYQADTTKAANGLDLSGSIPIENSDFQDIVYLGIVGNSTRKEMCISYLKYLYGVSD